MLMILLDWVLVMKKVVVIVINNGGMICYVVIVFCEMQILCIVGIKSKEVVVIDVLKIGDVVMVDVKNGVVY